MSQNDLGGLDGAITGAEQAEQGAETRVAATIAATVAIQNPVRPRVAVINASSVVGDAEGAQVVAALQRQVDEHYMPLWGMGAEYEYVPSGGTPQPGRWWLTILDSSDQAGALGYHDVTTEGLPIGKVFAGTDKLTGNSWTVTLSHEALEQLGDPEIDLTVFIQDSSGAGTLYSYENCDACEDDQYGYTIDGILLSDFVTPAWFCPSLASVPGMVFDYRKLITQPLALLSGGYIGIYRVGSGTGWTQITAQRGGALLRLSGAEGIPLGHENAVRRGPTPYQARARVGSRRERRRTPKDQWAVSTAHADKLL